MGCREKTKRPQKSVVSGVNQCAFAMTTKCQCASAVAIEEKYFSLCLIANHQNTAVSGRLNFSNTTLSFPLWFALSW